MANYMVGIDIGGTFTDLVLIEEATGIKHSGKILTTVDNPANGVMEGLKRLLETHRIQGREIARCVHGTTLVINTLIERQGARVGLVMTRGFKDVLEFGTEQRYDIYDLRLRFPQPLVPRTLIQEVDERVLATGEEFMALDEEQLSSALELLREAGIEALAVTLLHSYRNPDHENRVQDAVRGMDWDVPVSLSHQVVAEIREYERASTTAANAYVQPLTESYLDSLQQQLEQMESKESLYIMLSAGGVATVETARKFPIRMVESGPAAGALAASYYARLLDRRQVLAFDMGGTTAKLSTIVDFQPRIGSLLEVDRVHRFMKGSGLPLRVPVVDLIEIGTGGGSIAYQDHTGMLRVGPRSSGANPGPACYGLGGNQPTVTDANLLLGYLAPDSFLGGEMLLDVDAARAAMESLAGSLGLDLTATAWGVHEVANENMANAARVHLAENGGDPRKFTLIAFGGAGPAHARRIGRKLGVREIVFPAGAGVMSAFGLLATPVSFDFSHSHLVRLDSVDWAEIRSICAQMERQAVDILERAGVPAEQIEFTRTADMRYFGQEHEINVRIPDGPLSADAAPTIQGNFEAEFANKYYWMNPDAPVEILNWRVRASGPTPVIPQIPPLRQSGDAAIAVKGQRPVFLSPIEGWHDCNVYDRYRLTPGMDICGPAIVEEHETTVVVGQDERAHLDSLSNLIVTKV